MSKKTSVQQKVCFSFLYALLISVFSCGCQNSVESASQIEAYIANSSNGLTKTIEASAGTVSLQYIPAALMAARELENSPEKVYYDGELDSLYKAFNQRMYFRVQLSRQGESIESFYGKDLQVANAMRSHLLHDIINDFGLKISVQKNIRPIAHFYAGSPADSPHTTLILVFERNQVKDRSLELNYQDRLFGYGDLSFELQAADLEAVPALSFKR